MKPPVSPHMVALLLLSAIAPLSAQNLASTSRSSEVSNRAELLDGNSEQGFVQEDALPGNYEVPAVEKAQGNHFAMEPTMGLNLLRYYSKLLKNAMHGSASVSKPATHLSVTELIKPCNIKLDSILLT